MPVELLKLVLVIALTLVLNVWLIWWVGLLIALVVVYGGFLILTGDITD